MGREYRLCDRLSYDRCSHSSTSVMGFMNICNLLEGTPVLLYMTSRIAYRIFITCLFPCALLVITAVWLQDRITWPYYFSIVATLFVTGLAAFLIWFSLTLTTIRKGLER